MSLTDPVDATAPPAGLPDLEHDREVALAAAKRLMRREMTSHGGPANHGGASVSLWP